ncbi:hypothetical protein VP01_10857g1, partial [Puccinia sorghi]
KFQEERQINANLNLSGIAHLPFHISNTNPNSMIQFFNEPFIFWADQSWEKIISVVKLYPFSTMDTSLKSRYQHLSQHLIAQISYQNLNQSIKNWHNSHDPEQKTFIGKHFYLFLVLYLMKSRGETMLENLDWNPTSKKILTVLLAIYPSLSPILRTKPTKTMQSLVQ